MKQNLFENLDYVVFTPETLCKKVYDFLRDAIIQEKIEPGEKLNVSYIASKLGVSRSPVREAIRLLEAHDFVETLPQKGAYVREITPDEISDLFVVLRILLTTAAHLTTNSLNEESRNELLSIIIELESVMKTRDAEKAIDASRRFHNYVVAKCQNKLLFKLHESLLVYRERPYLLMKSMSEEDFTAIIEEPLTIAGAILNGDAEKVQRLMEIHMSNASDRNLRAIDKRNKNKYKDPSG